MMTDEPEESLLSPELMEELGGEEASLVVSKKKKDKRKRSEEPSEAVKLLAKKMSKSEKKRIEQITKRKAKELKRSEYLQVIHDNSISDTQRMMFTSTNDIGQTQTLKQLLSSILKKQKAGLALSEEEKEILYKQKVEDLPSIDSFQGLYYYDATKEINNKDEMNELNKEADKPEKSEKSEEPDLLFSFDSFSDPVKSVEAPAAMPEKQPETVVTSAKKGSKRKASSAPVSTIGSSLLQQLSALKNKLAAPVVDSSPVVVKTKKPKVLQKTLLSNKKAKVASKGNSAGADNDEEYSDSDSDDNEEESSEEDESDSDGDDAPELVTLPPEKSESRYSTASTAVADKQREENASMEKYLEGKKTYIPQEIPTPVDEVTGEIIVPADRVAAEKALEMEAKKHKMRVFSVNRPHEIELSRMQLPVCSMEQEIVEAINGHDVVILCGETGSGKSTQVPQFLYEAGYANNSRLVGITQPRRVAVTSTANRVAFEMGVMDKDGAFINNNTNNASVNVDGQTQNNKSSKKNKNSNSNSNSVVKSNVAVDGCLVGYQIRFDSTTVGSNTRIKFMTDGILLREITHDLMLRHYNVIILDEAHERNINTDVLLGLISRTLPLRRAQYIVEQKKWNKLTEAQRENFEPPLQPLKLVIMSATMRVTDFQNPVLFPSPPPIISVEARQFPVTTHFAKRTELKNYLQATHKKVCQIHRKLPDGGVLVFLTGKREILYMCHKLNKSLNKGKKAGAAAQIVSLSGTGVSDGGAGLKIASTGAAAIGVSGKSGPAKEDISFVSLGGMDEAQEEMEEGGGGNEFNDEREHDLPVSSNSGSKSSKNNKSNKKGSNTATTTSSTDHFDVEKFYAAYSSLGGAGGDDDQDEILSDYESDEESDDEVEEKEEVAQEQEKAVSTTADGAGATTEVLSIREQMLRAALGGAPANADGGSTETIIGGETVISVAPAVTTPVAAAPTVVAADNLPPPVPLKALILPLYAMMPPALQARIFAAVPEGYRLIVVATNVAETSITIPNIRYVVDCGRQKEKVQSTSSAVAKYEVQFISKASADQRQGRSGRTGPGHCYRLYSANFYHQHMVMFQPPEIMNTPLEDLILQMKAIGIEHIHAFPFPTAPPPIAVHTALSLLTYLGAVCSVATANTSSSNQILAKLDHLAAAANKNTGTGVPKLEDSRGLTELGQRLVKFPVNPRYAKMLVLATELQDKHPNLLPYVLTLVSTLAEKSIFTFGEESSSLVGRDLLPPEERESEVEGSGDEDEAEALRRAEKEARIRRKLLVHHEHGDAMARLRAAGAYMYTVNAHISAINSANKAIVAAMKNATAEEREMIQHKQLKYHLRNKTNTNIPSVTALCDSQHLHPQTLQSIMELRGQLQDICEAQSLSTGGNGFIPIPLSPPTVEDERLIRQILLRGYCDSIAKLVPLKVITEGSVVKRTTAYYSCNPNTPQPLYIHPNSNLYDRNHDQLPKYIMYGNLLQNKKGDTTYMTCNTILDERWISLYAEDCPLLTYSAPLASPTPSYDAIQDTVMCYVTPTYGARGWVLPSVQRPLFEYSLKAIVSYHSNEVQSGAKNVSAKAMQAAIAAESSVPIGFRKVDEVYRWFARLLLEGSVRLYVQSNTALDGIFRKMFAEIKSRGLAAIITEKKPEPRVSEFLRKLISKEIRTLSALKLQLQLEPSFLSEEIQAFLPMGSRSDFRKAWSHLALR